MWILAHHPHGISLVVPCRILLWFPLCSSVKTDPSTDLCHWYSQHTIGCLHQVLSTVQKTTECADQCSNRATQHSFQWIEFTVEWKIHSREREYNVAKEYNVASVYWFHRGVKFEHEMKTKKKKKTWTKYHSKIIQMQLFHAVICLIGLYEACKLRT